MTNRYLRLFMLRYLPRRLFAILSLLEFVALARQLWRATSPAKPSPKFVGRSGYDDDPEPAPASRRRT